MLSFLYIPTADGDEVHSSKDRQAVKDAARDYYNERRATAAGGGGGERSSKKVRHSDRDSSELPNDQICSQGSAASSVASELDATRRSKRATRFSTGAGVNDDDKSNQMHTGTNASDMHTENDDVAGNGDVPTEVTSTEPTSSSSGTVPLHHPAADTTAINTADESFADMIIRTSNNMLTHSNNILAARDALLHIGTLTQTSCQYTDLPFDPNGTPDEIVAVGRYMEYLKAVCIIHYYIPVYHRFDIDRCE